VYTVCVINQFKQKIPVTVLCCDSVHSDTWIPNCTVSQHRSQYELAGYILHIIALDNAVLCTGTDRLVQLTNQYECRDTVVELHKPMCHHLLTLHCVNQLTLVPFRFSVCSSFRVALLLCCVRVLHFIGRHRKIVRRIEHALGQAMFNEPRTSIFRWNAMLVTVMSWIASKTGGKN